MVFTHVHIAVTAVVTGAITASLAIWRFSGTRRVIGGLTVGVVAAASVYLFRASANVPQLNADGLPGMSANDWLAAVVTFVSLGVLAGLVTLWPRDRFSQVRAGAAIVAFAVNVITI